MTLDRSRERLWCLPLAAYMHEGVYQHTNIIQGVGTDCVICVFCAVAVAQNALITQEIARWSLIVGAGGWVAAGSPELLGLVLDIDWLMTSSLPVLSMTWTTIEIYCLIV